MWVHGVSAIIYIYIYIYELIFRSMVSYYMFCRNYVYIYLSFTYTMYSTIQKYAFCSYRSSQVVMMSWLHIVAICV